MGISAGIIKLKFICAVHALLGSKYAIKMPQMVLSNSLVNHIDSVEYLENHSYHENMVFIAHVGQTHHKSHLQTRPQAARLSACCWAQHVPGACYSCFMLVRTTSRNFHFKYVSLSTDNYI